MSLFRLLGRKKAESAANEPKHRTPVPGEIWRYVSSDPWEAKVTNVRILDVKEGWVRYYMGELFPDNRMELRLFLGIYRHD